MNQAETGLHTEEPQVQDRRLCPGQTPHQGTGTPHPLQVPNPLPSPVRADQMAELGNSISPSRGQAGQAGASASAGQVTSITPEAQLGDLPQAEDQPPGKTQNHKYDR